MNKYSFLVFSTMFFTVSLAHAQKYTFDSVEPISVIKEIKRDNGQLYNLVITLPPDYQPEKEYKILYYLDAWWLKDLVMGCYRIKSQSNKSTLNNMDEVILVGISSVGDEKAWNRQRNMDFTPSKYSLNLVIDWGGVQLNATTTGGAEAFLQFFKKQIIESVESEYKVDSTSRGILGHSFGGLLGFYAYVNHSDLFSNYILISPSVWWNESEMFQDKESIVSKRNATMFIALGTADAGILKRSVADLLEELKQERNGKVKMTYKQYENADHHSVLPQAIYDGIESLYTVSK